MGSRDGFPRLQPMLIWQFGNRETYTSLKSLLPRTLTQTPTLRLNLTFNQTQILNSNPTLTLKTFLKNATIPHLHFIMLKQKIIPLFCGIEILLK